ncbi:MAG: aspartyl/asparaginyl beta-hydroxylase domain-containing protein [Steroidobacteraceae bacterium]
MLDLPGHPVIDKALLVGGCTRLPLAIDAARLAAEVAALPAAAWGTRGGRGGVHEVAEAIFLRGHAPAEGDRPIEDRAPLALLPYVRHLITELVPAPAQRCLLARLPGGAMVAPHVDQAPYFAKTIRIHVPVETHARAWMMAAGRRYRMALGEAWALNNSAPHAVANDDPLRPRTHLICDFLPTPALLDLLLRGERNP